MAIETPATCVEIVIAHLKPEIAATNVEDSEDFQFLLNKGRSTPGVIHVRYGRMLEDREQLVILVEWESLEQHLVRLQDKEASAPYIKFWQRLCRVPVTSDPSFDGAAFFELYHFFAPHERFEQIMSCPVTEVILSSAKAAVDTAELVGEARKSWSSIDSVEDRAWCSTTYGHDRLMISLLGWKSIDHHKTLDNLKWFTKQGADKVEGTRSGHVRFCSPL